MLRVTVPSRSILKTHSNLVGNRDGKRALGFVLGTRNRKLLMRVNRVLISRQELHRFRRFSLLRVDTKKGKIGTVYFFILNFININLLLEVRSSRFP